MLVTPQLIADSPLLTQVKNVFASVAHGPGVVMSPIAVLAQS